MKRCSWLNLNNPIYVKYHDEEWGRPVRDDHKLFEMLLLESFQAGLSWECILNKRESFQKSFDNYDYKKISNYTESKVEELMQNKGIIRNRRKILATIKNAQVFIEIQKEFGSFSNYIWGFTNKEVIKRTEKKLPASTPLSDKISKDLKKRGMKYTGTVIIYSYLQAIGVVNDHDEDCFRFN